MKVLTSNVNNLLLDRLETLELEDHSHWRCIYMRLHDKQERFNAMLRTHFINRAIVELLERDEGYIYFCEDGDILILFEGALKPIAAKLAGHFGDLDPNQLRGQLGDSLFTFFDLNKHWEEFYALCREKASRILSLRQKLPTLAPYLPARRQDRVNA